MNNTQDVFNKIDFKKILERNLKENEGTPVSGLLRSTTQEILPAKSKENELVINQIKVNELTDKIDNLEGLIQSIIINQQNTKQAITHIEPMTASKSNQIQFNSRLLIALASIALIIFSVTILLQRNKKAEVVKFESISEVKEKKFITTKYVNLRFAPSVNAKIQTTISPNSFLTLLEEKDGWKKVEFKNHAKNLTLFGWLYADNIKEIK